MKILCKYLRIYVLLAIVALATSLKTSQRHSNVSVQSGSSEVLLDCPYVLNEGDSDGLVIKWFYEDEVTPSFQWIPKENKYPQDIGFLKGKLNVSYNVTRDKYTSYRALYIKEPTLELNGLYTCYVSNFLEEDIAQIQLTVYIPASNFTIDYYEEEEEYVTFICQADGVYPEPHIELYSTEPKTENMIKIADANVSLEYDEESQTYNATLYKTFLQRDLNTSNSLGCSLNINQTDYSLDVAINYYTGPLPSISPTLDTYHYTGENFTEDNKIEENLSLSFEASSSSALKSCSILFLFASWCALTLNS